MKMTINSKEYEIGLQANLRGANLYGANLYEANLYGANLCGANLCGANLCGANLYGANLYGAELREANLYGAELREANLYEANLRGANLRGANLYGANLYGANLREAKNIPDLVSAMTLIAAEGDLVGYKKLADGSICKLRIPADAKRSNATGRKCRAEYAVVLEGSGVSQYDKTFEYRIGETVRPREPFNEDRWEECGSGIHFFLTRKEAETY